MVEQELTRIRRLSETVKSADTVILASRNARLDAKQSSLGLKLATEAKTLIVISTCDPYDFISDERIENYMSMYEPTLEAFEAAVNIIFGVARPTGILPVLNPKPQWSIQPFDIDRDVAQLTTLWDSLLPAYRVPAERLASILRQPVGAHFAVSESSTLVGFVATFTSPGSTTGFIAMLLVRQTLQNRGVGSALLRHARKHLTSPPNNCTALSLGSSFPRIFCGMPTDVSEATNAFFIHRGFRPGTISWDLYQDVRHFVAPEKYMRRARDAGVTFAPWSRDGEAECLAKQRRFFGDNASWVGTYERLAALGRHGQALVAFGSDGEQVGWTLMVEPGMPVWEDMAMPGMPADKTGMVACVGVDPAARRHGVGLALVATATESLRDRGVEGVLIDWLVLRDWYGKVGYEVFREYRGMEWRGAGH